MRPASAFIAPSETSYGNEGNDHTLPRVIDPKPLAAASPVPAPPLALAVRTARARGGAGTGEAAAKGFGSMTLGNVWSFPSLPYDVSLGAMKALAGRIRKITADHKEPGHPIDIHTALEPAYLEAAADVSRELR